MVRPPRSLSRLGADLLLGARASADVRNFFSHTGSFATASCLLCKRRFPGAAIEADVFASRVPLCPYCTPELEELEREKEREKAERPRKRKKVGRDEWDQGGSDESEDGADEGRSEWEGKGLVKPDIVFFGCVPRSLRRSCS